MGAENSALEGCQWGDEVLAAGLEWDLQHAESKDGRPITVFQPRKNERKYNDMIQQLAKSLKMLRHPSILHYIGAGKLSEGYFFVTEQATPLAAVLDKLLALEVCCGLSDILDALMFLHDRAGVTHNNISIAAIFVSKDGGWKLGELQHACPFNVATAEFLDACRAFRDQDALAPEEKQNGLEVKPDQGHARDMYGMGVLCEQLSEQLSELGEFSKSFEEKIAACLSSDPSHRPRALELKNDRLFQSDFIQILNFVRNVALKTTEEKAEFFRNLLPRLLALPEELVARRLAIPLLSRFVLLEETAVSHVVPQLLTPRSDQDSTPSTNRGVTPLLSTELFRNYITPELERIFLVHDIHIRLVLLQHFSRYVDLFERDVLHNDIFPQILLGLRDSNDSIVASSLRALADLVPLLGGDIIIGGQRKSFFFQGMPKFLPMRDKEDTPRSVSEVLKPAKSIKSLSNGKPLLKDLAAGFSSSTSKDSQWKRKQLERECRREEARKKKEERQRKFQLLRAEMEKEQQNAKSPDADDKGMTDDSTDTFSGSDNTRQTSTRPDTGSAQTFDTRNKPADLLKDSAKDCVNKDDGDKTNSGTYIEEEKFASEDSGEDWEDWEDKDRNSVPKSEEDLIGDEIEAELSQMSVNRPLRGGGKKVPTSPDPYVPSSPNEVGWSDSQFDSVSSSPKHFQSDWMKGEKELQKHLEKDAPSLKSEKSSDSKQISGKGLKLVAKHKATPVAKTTQVKKQAANDDLGLGYDIKSIELSVVKEEDFFADMMPDIKPTVDKGLIESSMRTGSKTVSDHTTTQGPGLSLFAVAETVTEESTGWDEDGDWGAEDF